MFERSTTRLGGSLPIRKTSAGIWVPTPVPVITMAARLLEEMGLLGDAAPGGLIVDAGTGDGRVPAVLASLDPTRPICGIEADALLYTQAVANLEALSSHRLDSRLVTLIEGDYCDTRAYTSHALDLRDIGMFLNYPDGHEQQLARFVARHAGAAAKLVLLTHDRSVGVRELELCARRRVVVAGEQDWELSVYQRAR